LGKVSPLNSAGYQSYMKGLAMPLAKMGSSVGLGDPQTLAIKSLYGRVSVQVFIMSFEQLCWVVMGIVALGLIPLYLIKPGKVTGPIIDAH
jgi:hypothetical protein